MIRDFILLGNCRRMLKIGGLTGNGSILVRTIVSISLLIVLIGSATLPFIQGINFDLAIEGILVIPFTFTFLSIYWVFIYNVNSVDGLFDDLLEMVNESK